MAKKAAKKAEKDRKLASSPRAASPSKDGGSADDQQEDGAGVGLAPKEGEEAPAPAPLAEDVIEDVSPPEQYKALAQGVMREAPSADSEKCGKMEEGAIVSVTKKTMNDGKRYSRSYTSFLFWCPRLFQTQTM